jgi:hypothetical protein
MNKKTFIPTLRKEIDIISDEISDLLYKQDVFENRVKSLLEDPSIDHHIKTEIVQNHYSAVLSAVRRQLGTQDGEISLLRLLTKLRDNNTSITKEWYAEEWLRDSSLLGDDRYPELKGFVERMPVNEFERMFGDEYLDKQRVVHDITVLKSATKTIKAYVDKRIAHRDKTAVVNVTEGEYIVALELLEKLTKKYILLLKQVGMVRLKPVIQD